MNRAVSWIDRTLYPSMGSGWDDAIAREAILRHMRQNSVALDLGAGSGRVPSANFRSLVSRVCGLDPSPAVLENPYLDEAVVGSGDSIPYPDGSFDVVFSFNVLEHLESPKAVFKEVSRVMRPGGVFVAKTPNRRHYVPTLARLIPNSLHGRVVRSIKGRSTDDTFPTFYRANTAQQLAVLASSAGLTVQIATYEGRPEYLRFGIVPYLMGAAYERAARLPLMASFRAVIVATFTRPSEGTV